MGVSALTLVHTLAIALAAGGIGRLARGLWLPRDEPVLDRLVLDLSMGFGMLSLVFFALAALHRLDLAQCLVVLFFGGTLGLCVGTSAIGWLKQRRWPSPATCIWVILFLCLALAVLIPALAPPSGSDWDSLAYHLAIPKLYLQHGGFYYIDWVSHSNFPFLVEMLYTPALAMDDPAGAKMVHYLYGVLLVLAVVMLTRKHFGAKAAPLAALAIAGMPIVMWEATTAYVDLATALYTVVAIYLLLDNLDKPELRSIIGCGIAVGFAASTKMTGLALIPMLLAWLLIDRWAAVRRVEWKPALAFAGGALLVCSPWYLKTMIYTGNPVYPFFYSIFGGKDWSSELAQNYTLLQAHFGVGHGLASFVMLPWDLTLHSDSFYDRPGLFIGPILLVAVPLLFAVRPKMRKLTGLILFFLAQLVVWFALTQQSRYLIPAFAILAVIIAAIAYSDERFRVTRVALYVTFAATALLGLYIASFSVRDTAPVVFGRETQDHYLSRTLPIYPAEKWINEHTPLNSKIALFGDTRGFYLTRHYVWADPGHNTRFTRGLESVDEFIAYLKQQRVTHAMVNFAIFPKTTGTTGTSALVYKAIAQGRFAQVYGDASRPVAVYKIR